MIRIVLQIRQTRVRYLCQNSSSKNMSNFLELKDESNNSDTSDIQDPDMANHVRGGANWFYWIAGLSVINSAIFAFGGTTAFIAGLGLTQLADAIIGASIEDGAPNAIRAVAIIFDLILIIIFALIGYYANKRLNAAFVIGIVIYTLDALVLLLLGALLMAGFHAFALFFIIRGFMASRKMSAYIAAQTPQPMLVPPPPTF